MNGGKEMTKQLTPKAILEMLDKHKRWTFSENAEDVIRYSEFKKILMFEENACGYERTCKEKWKLLIEFGIFTKRNQSEVVFVNLVEVRRKLGVNTVAHSVHMDGAMEEADL